MRRTWKAAVSLSLSAADGAIVLFLLTRVRDARELAALLVLHLLVAIATGVSLQDAAPSFLAARPLEVGLTTGLLAFAMPVVGPLGVAVVVMAGLAPPRKESAEPWVVFDFDASSFERPRAHRRRAVSAAAISEALRQRTPETAELRFQVVLATRQLPPKVGVSLLQLAQSDPSDEVRLFAFSRLERMRDELETQTKTMTEALAGAAETDERARLHLRLAQCYWELGYLGLAEGAVLDHALQSAHLHAATATELLPQHGAAEFFLGRILVHMRDPTRATVAFERAISSGYPRVKVLPFLADCAFQHRDFAGVRGLLRELDASSPENLFFRPVMEFWRERAAGPVPPPPGSRTSLTMKGVRA